MTQAELLSDLDKRLLEINNWAKNLQNVDDKILRSKPSETSWSALECLDHLNRYGDFYLPIFQEAIEKASKSKKIDFKPGWLGKKLALDMLPQNGKLKSTMNTFKSKNPSLDGVNPEALAIFINQQEQFLELIEKAAQIDLGSKRVKTTIPVLKLKLGDALRFVVFHEVRHFEQAKRAMTKYKSPQSFKTFPEKTPS